VSRQIVRHAPIVRSFPHILHGGDYNPDQWLRWKDTIWKEDMRLARLAGINTLSVGIFSWTALEPEEGKYRFDWLDEVMDMLAENEIVAVLATPSGARPTWMSQRYPEVLRVTNDRRRILHGARHNHCLTSPVYREKTLPSTRPWRSDTATTPHWESGTSPTNTAANATAICARNGSVDISKSDTARSTH